MLKTTKLNIRIQICNIQGLLFKYSNIRIYSCYTVKFGKSQHADLKNEEGLKNEYDNKH